MGTKTAFQRRDAENAEEDAEKTGENGAAMQARKIAP
jgi:hypothetical protein